MLDNDGSITVTPLKVGVRPQSSDSVVDNWHPWTVSNSSYYFSTNTLTRTNTYCTDDVYVIKTEMPGVNKKDLFIELKGYTIEVKGVVNLDADELNTPASYIGSYMLRSEIHNVFSIASDIVFNPDRISAELKDGILTIVVPLIPSEISRRIAVK